MPKTPFTANRVVDWLVGFLFFSLSFTIAGGSFFTILLYFVFLILWKRERIQFQYHPILIGMGLMLLSYIISTLFAADPFASLKDARRFWRFGLPFCLMLALTGKDPAKYLLFIAYSALPISIYAIMQHFYGIDFLRPDTLQLAGGIQQAWHAVGTFSHHLTFGGVMLPLFFLFFGMGFSKDLSLRRKAFFFGVAFFVGLAAIYSFGRSIWLGLLIGIPLLLILLAPKKFHLLLLGVILSGGLGFWLIGHNQFVQQELVKTPIGNRLVSATSQEQNADRLYMWEAAKRMIADSPWVGHGAGSHATRQKYYDQITLETGHQFLNSAEIGGVHNIYLQLWIDFGILGLLGFIFWQVLILWALLQYFLQKKGTANQQMLALGLITALIATLIAGFFSNNFWDGEVQQVMMSMYGMTLSFFYKMNPPATTPN